jgi:hypothetical protein
LCFCLQRQEFLQYYDLTSSELYFHYVGTTRLPLTAFRPRATPVLQTLNDKIRVVVLGWEKTHNMPFELDGQRLLDTLDGPDDTRSASKGTPLKASARGTNATPTKPALSPRPVSTRSTSPVPIPSTARTTASQSVTSIASLSTPQTQSMNLPPAVIRMNLKKFVSLSTVDSVGLNEDPQDPSWANYIPVTPKQNEDDGSKMFRVFTRLRPLLSHEIERGDTVAISPDDDGRTVQFSTKALAVNTVSLTFDACLSGEISQVSFCFCYGSANNSILYISVLIHKTIFSQ